MPDPSKVATASEFRAAEAAAPAPRAHLIQFAPGPEVPDTRDRAGVRRGMLILLISCGAFWAAAVALALYLLR